MSVDALIDGEPVTREIDARPVSAWRVWADGNALLTIAAPDIDPEQLADLAARETGAREVVLDALSIGVLALADSQPSFWQTYAGDGTQLTQDGHVARLGVTAPEAGPAPAHAGGELDTVNHRDAPLPVTAWRIRWADGRAWIVLLDRDTEDSAVVRQAIADTHPGHPFLLSRIDSGTVGIDRTDPVPAGFRCYIHARVQASRRADTH